MTLDKATLIAQRDVARSERNLLRSILDDLYRAGHWTAEGVPQARQLELWEAAKRALEAIR